MSYFTYFCLALLCWICSCANAGQLNTSFSAGYEKISSPLVRIDPDAPLIFIEGRSRVAGRNEQFSASGVAGWGFDELHSLDFSSGLSFKQSPDSKQLNYGTLSGDVTLHKKMNGLTVGIGTSVQRIWVANAMFRDSISIQSDITRIHEDGSFSSMFVAVSRSFHANDFDFMDSNSASVSGLFHLKDIGFGFSALDVQLNLSRDKNLKGSDDLSNYSMFGRASLDREMLGLTWSIGASVTQSYFDAPFLDGFAKRRDRYVSYEFGVERKLSNHAHLNFDVNMGKNYSNIALFESDYRSYNASFSYNF